jgi:hypothetical protein
MESCRSVRHWCIRSVAPSSCSDVEEDANGWVMPCLALATALCDLTDVVHGFRFSARKVNFGPRACEARRRRVIDLSAALQTMNTLRLRMIRVAWKDFIKAEASSYRLINKRKSR